MELVRLTRKPLYFDGVQVTDQNMTSVAEWCDGFIRKSSEALEGKLYIKVPVERPQNDRQTTAFVGDWVVRMKNGFKVYTKRAFEASVTLIEEESCGKVEQTTDHKPCVLGKGHLLHVACRSLTDYRNVSKEEL